MATIIKAGQVWRCTSSEKIWSEWETVEIASSGCWLCRLLANQNGVQLDRSLKLTTLGEIGFAHYWRRIDAVDQPAPQVTCTCDSKIIANFGCPSARGEPCPDRKW